MEELREEIKKLITRLAVDLRYLERCKIASSEKDLVEIERNVVATKNTQREYLKKLEVINDMIKEEGK